MGECLIIRSSNGTDTDGANATIDVVLEGYSCYVKDELIIGNIPHRQLVETIATSDVKQLLHGYYENSVVSVNILSDETVSTSTPMDVLMDNNGWSNGELINGSVINNGTVSYSLASNTSYTIPQGWHNDGKVIQTLSTQTGVNVTPGTSNKTVCAASKWTTGDLWIVGDSKLVSGNIKNGVNIFGKIGTWTGYVDNPLRAVTNNKSVLSGFTVPSFTVFTGVGISKKAYIFDIPPALTSWKCSASGDFYCGKAWNTALDPDQEEFEYMISPKYYHDLGPGYSTRWVWKTMGTVSILKGVFALATESYKWFKNISVTGMSVSPYTNYDGTIEYTKLIIGASWSYQYTGTTITNMIVYFTK